MKGGKGVPTDLSSRYMCAANEKRKASRGIGSRNSRVTSRPNPRAFAGRGGEKRVLGGRLPLHRLNSEIQRTGFRSMETSTRTMSVCTVEVAQKASKRGGSYLGKKETRIQLLYVVK